MKARTIVATTALAGLAVVLGPPAAPALAAKPASGNQTAQGIMVNMHGPDGGTVTVVDNKQYRFNELTASGYFTNTQSGDPTVSCNGSPTNCASDNQPATPSAPAPDPLKVNGTPQGPGAVQHNKCTFLGGGTLTGLSYQQSQTVSGLNGKGSWTFGWTYTVNPDPVIVDPLTAWDLVKEVTGSAQVDVNADIAGESVLVKNAGSWKKYSFSMLESDGTNRVTGLALTVKDAAGTIVASYAPNSAVHFPADFGYATNAGSNGAAGYLQDGDARTILNTDSFAGNKDGGSDGSALALATTDTTTVTFDPGDYTITLTGTVKGNSIDSTSTGANISFSVTQSVHIIAPGCGNPAT